MQHGFVVVTVAVVVAFLSGCGSTGINEQAQEEAQNLQKCVRDEWANMTAVRSKAEKCSPEFTSATEDVVQKLLQCCERVSLHSERMQTACRMAMDDTGHKIILALNKECPPPEEIAFRKCVDDRKQKLIAVESKTEKGKCGPEYAVAVAEFADKLDECCEAFPEHDQWVCSMRLSSTKDTATLEWQNLCQLRQIDLTEKLQDLFDSVPDARGFEQINLTEKLQDMFDSVPDVRDFEDASFTRTNVGMVALVVAAAGAAGASVALAITSLKTRRQ
eukprot:TRINITY_DN2526_c0_g2_i1.p1 TRINITY_DN2526_c0_g2~~TRINITY_DN2526_c0_g2_i1.p1  ORF type:complete len:301 (-),score=54.80 TRINITY_DN2526_c0_g2_i1:68-892(-)